MRMQKCPNCGSENSVRRTACYHCQQPLSFPPAEENPPQTAGSRWQAIEPLSRGPSRRVLRPAPQTQMPAGPQPRADARAPARSYMPTFRRPLLHVRRMGAFFRELHTLTRSGITVAAACEALTRHGPGRLRGLAGEMATEAAAGRPIHTAMERHPDLFYPWHIGIVRAAQAGGYLPEAFDQIAHGYEVEWETRAALLPRLVFCFLFLLPQILIAVPAIMMLSQPIPKDGWTPELVINTVLHYLRTISLPIVIGLIGLFLVWQALTATAWFQGVQQRFLLRLPLISQVARAAALDRYLATLGLLLRAGLPVAEAADQAAAATGNVALAPKLLPVSEAVRAGVPLAQALEDTRAFDQDTLSMAATGEVSGSLPDMLARAAGYYREEQTQKRRLLLRLGGIAMGVFWLAVAGAVFLYGLRAYFDYAFRVGDWMMQ